MTLRDPENRGRCTWESEAPSEPPSALGSHGGSPSRNHASPFRFLLREQSSEPDSSSGGSRCALLTRFLRLFVLTVSVLWAPSAAADDLEPKPKPLFRDFMGLNVHTVQFKTELYKPVTKRLRDYHGFKWDVGDDTDYYPRFPFAQSGRLGNDVRELEQGGLFDRRQPDVRRHQASCVAQPRA